MKSSAQMLLLVLVSLVASQPERSLATGPVKVFLLGGQSNMDGRASQSGLPAALRSPQTDVLLYTRTGTPGIGGSLVPLQPGSTGTDGFGREFGPEVTFGRSIADALPGEDFALIKHARGGSSLAVNWAPGSGSDYTNFRNTVTNGLAALTSAGHAPEIVGMLWVQGERDVVLSSTFANAYEANLTAFIADVRNEYGAELPFLIGKLSANQTALNATRLATVRQAQEDVNSAVSNTALIDADSFSVISGDTIHFSAAGQIAYGEAFATAALPFVIPEPSSLVGAMIGCFVLALLFSRRQLSPRSSH